MIRELKVTNLIKPVAHPPTKIALGDLHVIKVPVDLNEWRIHLATDFQRIRTSVQTVSRMIHSSIHGFKDGHHFR